MNTSHIQHTHKHNWHHLVEQIRHVFRDPLFWAIIVLAIVLIAMMFFAAMGPTLPPAGPGPMYPYPGA